METLEQFSKRTAYQGDLHEFCEWLFNEKLKSLKNKDFPKSKTIQEIENEIRNRSLWF